MPAPTQTVSGTTATCYEWYIVESGDSCDEFDALYGIRFDYCRSLNTFVDAACDSIYPGYAYCVNGLVATSSATCRPLRLQQQ